MKKFSIFFFTILIVSLFTACGAKAEVSTIKTSEVSYIKPEEVKDEIKVEKVLEQPEEIETPNTEEVIENEEPEEVEVVEEIPNIEDFWNRDNNYLNLEAYLTACGGENFRGDTLGLSDQTAVYYIEFGNYTVHIYTVYGGQVPNLLFGLGEDEIIAYCDFDRSEHQIMMTVVNEDNILIPTETLEVLPELIQALKETPESDLQNTLTNFIFL